MLHPLDVQENRSILEGLSDYDPLIGQDNIYNPPVIEDVKKLPKVSELRKEVTQRVEPLPASEEDKGQLCEVCYEYYLR